MTLHRQALHERVGQCIRVRTKIERYGSTPNGSKYLLTDVRDANSGDLLTDHLWMPIGNWAAGLREGDVVVFDAKVEPYVKGYLGRRTEVIDAAMSPSLDFHLTDPSNAEVVVQGPIPRIK